MIKVEITTNSNQKLNQEFIVSKQKLSKLRELEFVGGFKRFNLDIVDDEIKYKKVDYLKIVQWLKDNVFPDINFNLLRVIFNV